MKKQPNKKSWPHYCVRTVGSFKHANLYVDTSFRLKYCHIKIETTCNLAHTVSTKLHRVTPQST